MPELPEVETTRRGIQPHLYQQRISAVVIREPRLRWPIRPDLDAILCGLQIHSIDRRGKYLLLGCRVPDEGDRRADGVLILHLGMSGNLRVVEPGVALRKHDHLDILLGNGLCLRLNDPRRFGAVLWTQEPPEQHKLLSQLGPEPLEAGFNEAHLFQLARRRTTKVKSFIMDSHVVVGVGNIYANEALFRAGIHPQRSAGRISKKRYGRLVTEIKDVLTEAIAQGGTTLRDFTSSDGKPGYFSQQLTVYGRGGQPCVRCGRSLSETRIAQRASYFCRHCQS